MATDIQPAAAAAAAAASQITAARSVDDIADDGYGTDGEEQLHGPVAPNPELDLHPGDPNPPTGLDALPTKSLVTIHGLNMAQLKDLLENQYGVSPEVVKALKKQPAVHEAIRQLLREVGHIMTVDKTQDAIPFGATKAPTDGRHYAEWKEEDISRDPQKFSGRLGSKQGFRLSRHAVCTRGPRRADSSLSRDRWGPIAAAQPAMPPLHLEHPMGASFYAY
jgi:hypothetical protein